MVNINSISRQSSGRLKDTLSAAMADDIIAEKTLNGEYKSFDDLKNRVRGIGPAKIEKLREAGFTVSPTSSGGGGGGGIIANVTATTIPTTSTTTKKAAGGNSNKSIPVKNNDDIYSIFSSGIIPNNITLPTNISNSNATVLDSLGDLRMDVKGMEEQTWNHRSNTDMYTKQKKSAVAKLTPEVDHVFECQVLNAANQRVSTSIAYRTRGAQSALKNLFNSVKNLNVTTHEVNQKKKGPFMRWLHATDHGASSRGHIEDYFSSDTAALRENGTWANISSSVVRVYDELEREKESIRDAGQKRHADSVLEELHHMVERMGIM